MMNVLKGKDLEIFNKKGVFLYSITGVQHKSKTIDGKKTYYVGGLISTIDPDIVNDVVTQKGQDYIMKELEEKTIKLDYDHENYRDLVTGEPDPLASTKMPLGKRIEFERKENGVYVLWELNKNWKQINKKGDIVRTFKEVWESIEGGFFDQFSIAFRPIKTVFKQMNGVMMRLLDELTLLNVALTGAAINPNAKMSDVFAKSVSYLKSMEAGKLSKKNKEELKSYEKDGEHIHNDENAMGVHNHKELESEIGRLWDKIWDLSYKLEDMKYSEKTETSGLKSKEGTKMPNDKTDGTPDPAGVANVKGEKTEDQNTTPAADANAGSAPNTEGKSKSGSNTDPAQAAPEQNAEIKSDLKSLTASIKSLTDTVKDLKSDSDVFKKFLANTNFKGHGAENESAKGQTADVKSSNPLDNLF